MARKQKTDFKKKTLAPAQKKFTDREIPQLSFTKALKEVNEKEYNILVYYGIGGVGKSSLQKHLKEHHLDNNKDNIYSWVDLKLEANRTPHKTLRILAQNFKSKFQIKFPIFNIAYAIYWTKAFPDFDIKKEGLPFAEEGSQLSDILEAFLDNAGVIGTAINFLDFTIKKFQDYSFDSNIKNELKRLSLLEVDEIEDKLAQFFAIDIDNYKEKNPEKKVVIFLDTYEALWGKNRSEANQYTQDEWVREIITELTNILFVICGREKIKWAEIDTEWEADLNQHILGDLSKDDAKSFLDSCDITDARIQDKMIKSSGGLPYYLDLCVDTYYQIKDSGNTPTAKEFSEVGKDKIFERFMRYLSIEEQETLKVLAHARFYTKELFSLLIDKFKTGYPTTAMHQLNTFSFISEEDGKFFIHNLMRISLKSFQNYELGKEVNEFLFEHYNSKLENLDIKNISEENINALAEAFYYKEQIGDVEALIDWYNKPFNIFYKAAQYNVIMETSILLKNIAEEVLGDEHPDTAVCYDNLGLLYESLNILEKAITFYTLAFSIKERVFGENHQNTVLSLKNMTRVYWSFGDYEEAKKYAIIALGINKKVLGETHLDVAINYNDLGLIFQSQGRYEEAEALYIQALDINNKTVERIDAEIAAVYINLATLYQSQYKYKEAEDMYIMSLDILKQKLGKEHPDTAICYDKLSELYYLSGKYEDAEVYLKRGLTIREKTLGEEHPSSAETHMKLASLYQSQDRYKESEFFFKKALSINEKVFWKEHPSIAICQNFLAVLYESLDRDVEAETLYLQALAINDKLFDVEHPDIISGSEKLISLYCRQGKYKNALNIAEQYLGTDSQWYFQLSNL